MVTLNLSKWWSVILGAAVTVATAVLPTLQTELSAHPTIFALIASLLTVFAHQYGMASSTPVEPPPNPQPPATYRVIK
jgi:hypothetical protein